VRVRANRRTKKASPSSGVRANCSTGSIGEVVELALAELVEEGAIALIEWGELAAAALGDDALDITLTVPDNAAPSDRTLSISGRGRWAGRSGEVAGALAPLAEETTP
jgi:hypothetical protein